MHKHKSKSKSHRWGPWSEWTWDATQQAYVRVRQDIEGVREYEWDQRNLSVAQTPRDAAIEDITDRLGSLSPADEYAYVGESSGRHKSSKHDKSKGKEREREKEKDHDRDRKGDKEKERKREKDRGKEKERDKEKEKEKEKERHKNKDHDKDKGRKREKDRDGDRDKERGKEKEKEKSHRRRDDSDGKESPTAHDEPEQNTYLQDVQYAQTLQTRDYQQQDLLGYGANVAYSKARGAAANYTNASYLDPAYGPSTATDRAVDQSSAPYHDAAYPYAESSSAATARNMSYEEAYPMPEIDETQDAYHLSNAAVEQAAELDPRYRVEHSTKFQPGEIFKVFWPEPQGSASDNPKTSSKNTESQNKFGANFFVGFRRFIVVANDQGHCTCM
ncbi:hypothetical protein K4F52_009668 [Lecanicillium sp. MT-2017a]|nr:hypothetical protein K4F52_009668 [Lecanicillium sp. MT-2017a]